MDPAAELEQLRERAAVEGNEWLRMKLQAENVQRLVPLVGGRAWDKGGWAESSIRYHCFLFFESEGRSLMK